MKQVRIYSFIMCVLFFAAGCAEHSEETVRTQVETQETAGIEGQAGEQGQPVKLALKFSPADSSVYKVTMETDKSVQWEGDATKPKGFKGGHTGNKMEMTFAQQIQSVDDQGKATARITIKSLRYQVTIKNNMTLDFDSAREEDRSNLLSKLIGQNYTIEITPSGEVTKVADTSDALAAVQGDSAAGKVAVGLLSADAIKEQHTIPALPAADKNQLREADNWSKMKKVSFDLMGTKSYEKVYTLNEISEAGNRRIAIATMEALPSAEDAKQLHKEQTAESFSKMFDNTETYTGELKLDLSEGKVEKYREELLVEWFIVNPSPKDDEPPAALRMAATRLYSIEKVD